MQVGGGYPRDPCGSRTAWTDAFIGADGACEAGLRGARTGSSSAAPHAGHVLASFAEL
jgi:hypothetical protein